MSGLQPSNQGMGMDPPPYGMGLKYIGLAALSGNGYACYTPNHVPDKTFNHRQLTFGKRP